MRQGKKRDSDSNGEEDEKGRQRWGEEGRQREGVGGLKPRRRNGEKKRVDYQTQHTCGNLPHGSRVSVSICVTHSN